jgi:hypothetical protein
MGRPDSEFTIVQLEEFEEKLEAFIQSSNIFLCKGDGVQRFLDMSDVELLELGNEECLIASIKLLEYCNSVQRELNQTTAKVTWITNLMTKIVVDSSNSFDKYTKNDHKIYLLSKENHLAELLIRLRERVFMHRDVLTDVVSDYRSMAHKFGELARIKQ